MAVWMDLLGFIDGVFIDSLELTQGIEPCGQPGDVIVILINGFCWLLCEKTKRLSPLNSH